MSNQSQPSSANFLQVVGQHAEKASEQLEPILIEKFKVTAKSESCKCVVTATSDFDLRVNVIIIHECRDHAGMIRFLTNYAVLRLKLIVGQWKSITYTRP